MGSIINNHEILFWKVIHNKYIFKQIFIQLHSTQISYNNYKSYHVYNRIKFKNIISFKWLLENKQFQLLMLKIQNNCELLKFDIESIQLFFSSIINHQQPPHPITNNDNNNVNTITTITTIKPNKPFIELELFKELLKMLMDFKRIEFEITDLTFIAVESNNVEALMILISNDYSLKILPSTLEYAIQNSNPEIVEILINSKSTIIPDETRYISLKLALLNKSYKSQMVSLVLNSNLYISPPSLPIEEEQEDDESKSRKRLKLSDNTITICQINEYSSNTNNNNNNNQYKSKIEHLFTLDSIELQNKLVELDCFDRQLDPLIIKAEKFLFTKLQSTMYQVFIVYIKTYFKYYKPSENGSIPIDVEEFIVNLVASNSIKDSEKLKELQKFMVNKTKRNYLHYLYLYDELIPEFELNQLLAKKDTIIFIYCFRSLSFRSLQYLLDVGFNFNQDLLNLTIKCVGADNTMEGGYKLNLKKKYISMYPERTLAFIQLYLQHKSEFHGFQPFDFMEIVYEIIKLNSESLYRQLYEILNGSIEINRVKLELPIWNYYLPRLLVTKISYVDTPNLWIYDNELIDWISNCRLGNTNCGNIIHSNYILLRKMGKIISDSFEMSVYTKQKLEIDFGINVQDDQQLLENSLFEYPFIQSINLLTEQTDADIEVLDKLSNLQDMSLDLKYCNHQYSGGNLKFETMVQLLNYFNNQVDPSKIQVGSLFYRVLKEFVKQEGNSNILNTVSEVISFNFKLYPKESTRVLVQCINEYNLWGIKYILHNSGQDGIDDQLFTNEWDKETMDGRARVNSNGDLIYSGKLIFNNQLDVIYSSQNPTDIINTIEYWLCELENKECNQSHVVVFKLILNRCFQVLLSCKHLTTTLLLSIYRRLKSVMGNELQDRSLYHGFRYLGIRSPKLLKYYLTRPVQDQLLLETGDVEYDANFQYDGQYGYFDILPICFDVDVFTCEFILGESFNQVFDTLKYYLSTFPIDKFRGVTVTTSLPVILQGYFTRSVVSNLIYFLDTNRIDLFFKELEFVQRELDDNPDPLNVCHFPSFPVITNSLDNSPIKSIKKNSIYYEKLKEKQQQEEIPPPQLQQSVDQELTTLSIKSFSFSNLLIGKACTKLSIDQIQKFIEFNFKVSNFHLQILRESIKQANIEILNFLFTNYKIKSTDYQWDLILQDSNNSFLVIHFLINWINLNNEINQYIETINQLFIKSFSNGYINICELILKSNIVHNYHLLLSLLSTRVIQETINNKNIHIIKYFYEKGLLDLNLNDFIFLNNDFKYFNFKKKNKFNQN